MFQKLRFKPAIIFCTLLIYAGLTREAQAQVKDNTVANAVFLESNGTRLLKLNDLSRKLAFSRAKEKGWQTIRKKKDGGIVILQGVDELGLPIYFTTYNNTIAAATTQTNALYSGGSLGLSFNGSSITGAKFAIWDGGAVLTNHIEFAGSRVEIKDGTTSTSTHSTHVAGTVMASGLNPAARGMAYGLPKLYSFDFSDDSPEMSANAANMLLSNHSYGSVAGWDLNSDVTPERWEFYGSAGANEDFKFGYYDSQSAEWDKICYNAPYYLPVKSAGNNRSLNGPAVGSPYYRYNANGAMANAGNRPAGISSNDGYDIIATYGNAKNIITVGAINPLPNGPGTAASIQIATFSSWGPTDDGRIKPDLVGDGVNVTSTSDESTTAYTTYSGTSMASPNVSGSLMLLQELYAQRNPAKYMRAATLKALALGTATDAGNAGPDYIYGWGLLNMRAAAQSILDNGSLSSIQERSLAQGEVQTLDVIASGSGPLVATICWTDPESVPVNPSLALDNTSLRLVNDLDLRIISGSNNYSPWVLNPASPAAAATTGDNFRDNIEQVYLADAIPGKTYRLQFSHKGTLQRGPQAYSLVLTGVGGQAYCASKAASTADTKITRFALSNIDNKTQVGCTDYSDYSSMKISLEAGKTYPLTIETGTCGQLQTKSARVYADWNGNGNFEDAGELLYSQALSASQNSIQTTIQVPATLSAGRSSLLRVIVSETSDPATIAPCGSYGKGETQDYSLQFNGPSADVGVTALLNPTSGACANAQQSIKVTVRNYGTATQSAIPVTAVILLQGNVVATLTGILSTGLASLDQREFTFPASFAALAGQTYTIQVKTNLPGDVNAANDLVSAQLQVSAAPIIAAQSSAYYCTSLKSYLLSSPNNETVFWYKSAAATTPFAFGNQVLTTEAPSGTSYYAGINDYSAIVGPANKNSLGSGGYNQFTPDVNINTMMPVLLESARLYVGNSGRVKFTVNNSVGIEVSSTTIDVTATRANPAAGALDNDLADVGQRYVLNLRFPAAGNYTVHVDYLDGATLFRNNLATTSYPYTTALDMFSITGNSATLGNQRASYYYLYELQVQPLGCAGAARFEVPVIKPVITRNGNTLSLNFPGVGYQWFLNGVPIAMAPATDYHLLANGIYTAEVFLNSGCLIKSEEFAVTDIAVKSLADLLDLKIFPNPTGGAFFVQFTLATPTNVEITVSDMIGRRVYTESKANYLGLYSTEQDINKLPSGIYLLTLRVGGQQFTKKIVLVKP